MIARRLDETTLLVLRSVATADGTADVYAEIGPKDREYAAWAAVIDADRQASESFLFHLPGKHDQKSHGRGGSGSADRQSLMQHGSYAASGAPVGESLNKVERGTITGEDGTSIDVIAKRRGDLYPMTGGGMTPGTDFEREVAAYAVNDAMGGAVEMPMVAIRKGETWHDDQFVMEWVDGTDGPLADRATDDVYKIQLTERGEGQMRDLALLDAVIGSQDRHSGNLLVREVDGKIDSMVAIDNGVAFPSERSPYPSMYALNYANRDIGVWDDVPSVALRPADRSALQRLKDNPPDLSGNLSPAEIAEMNLRVDFMLTNDRLIARNEMGDRPWSTE